MENKNNPIEKKDDKKLKALVILQFIVIACLLAFLYKMNTQVEGLTETVSVQDQEIQLKKLQLKDQLADLERIREEREKLGLENDSLDSHIETINKYVKNLEKKKKLNLAQIRSLNKMVASLKTEITEKESEIAILKEENEYLTGAVDSLHTQNVQYKDSLGNINEKHDILSSNLEHASILKAEDIIITGLKESGKPYKKQPFPGKKLAQISISFDIADNKAAKHNDKDFLVRLIVPSGECFSDKRNGGGNFQTSEGESMKYTLSKKLRFNNSGQSVSVSMLKGFNYKPGSYIVQVYCEGNQIGQGSFIVK